MHDDLIKNDLFSLFFEFSKVVGNGNIVIVWIDFK